MIANQQAAFEEWAASRGMLLRCYPSGDYVNHATFRAWQAWQAAVKWTEERNGREDA